MEIKASDVKALREKTGAGMMECKKALVEAGGDSAAAEKILKEKGLAALEKRADRVTSEGRIVAKVEGNRAVICEITCETDFVAKNTDFIALGDAIVEKAIATKADKVTDELSDMMKELATRIRENMTVRRLDAVELTENDYCAKYIHSDAKSGVLVVLSAENKDAVNNQKVKDFAYDCCLHYVAFTPMYVTQDQVSGDYINEQKEIFMKQVADMDKPEQVKAGIVQGKIKKHLAEICFMDQPFVKDDKVTVAKKLEEISKEAGSKISVKKVIFYQLGL